MEKLYCPICKSIEIEDIEKKIEPKDFSLKQHECKECKTIFSMNENLEIFIEKLDEDIKIEKDEKLRMLADFENIKKRLEKEKITAINFAQEKFAFDMLEVIDTLEIASNQVSDSEENKNIKEGIELTLKKIITTFEKYGIKEIDANTEFDSNFHEALINSPNENKKDGDINEIFSKGFTYNNRLLRPAKVSIVKN